MNQRQEEAICGRGDPPDGMQVKTCSSSSVISTLQIKITMRYHLHPHTHTHTYDWQKLGSWIIPSGGQDVGILEFLVVCRLVEPFWRAALGQIQYAYTLWPSSATVGMDPR